MNPEKALDKRIVSLLLVFNGWKVRKQQHLDMHAMNLAQLDELLGNGKNN